MKILYAIQGTGNGHLSRARDIIPLLQKKGSLDVLVSGCQADLALPHEVKYKLKGLSFIFGKTGGVDFVNTFLRNNSRTVYQEINKFPIEQYDLIINDFEPITAWAAHYKKKPCIALSHQSAVLSKKSPKPEKSDRMGEIILKNYAPASSHYGFHFDRFDKNIFTPVIRKEIRALNITDLGHYTVYLPSYDDERLIKNLSKLKDVKWEIFSKHNKQASRFNNIFIYPVNNENFIKSLASCHGILCGAGFETPAEALYLNKKLMVIPMKHQYEQHCNAAALKHIGVPVVKSLKEKHLHHIENWIADKSSIHINYPDETEAVIDQIIEKHSSQQHPENSFLKQKYNYIY